ncbi:phospho-sugar mutase [bacterium]|nr:phospho-sugar mutase [bacterium]
MNPKSALRLLELHRELGEIDDAAYENAKRWLSDPAYRKYRADVADLLRPTDLVDSFYRIIPFGTGGRRGPVGVGPNRINERTIGESAQGLARYILDVDTGGKLAKRGVAIAYDVRPQSRKFAEISARVLAANGVRVHLFDTPRPTPLLSFAVRQRKCVSGIVITASHNPPTDNGFKAYWDDGGQVVPPHDTEILKRVMAVGEVKTMPLAAARQAGLVRTIGKEIDKAYLDRLPKDLWLCDERDVRIVYTPLHGTGVTIIPRALVAMGFRDVIVPGEQATMDGTFPTVPRNYPNPEEPPAMKAAVDLAREKGAFLVLASDPDADRVGCMARERDGSFSYISGNKMGAAMLHFVLASLAERGEMPKAPFTLTTLVSTQLARAIAGRYRTKIKDDLLVGFKYVAEYLAGAEAGGKMDGFVFAFEESIGFLRGPHVRDKDAAAAAVTLAQLGARLVATDRTLSEYLDEIYANFGYFVEEQFSVFLTGANGHQKMEKIMSALRSSPPQKIADMKVRAVIDRKTGTMRDLSTGKTRKIKGAKGDVMQFWFDDEGRTRVTVRPSGTEPKIKHYAAAFEPVENAAGLKAAKKRGDARVHALIDAVKAFENKIVGARARSGA